jgi:stage III sporulation protein AA
MRAAEEFRLRCGFAPTVLAGGREVPIGTAPVSGEDLFLLLQIATGASAHTALNNLRSGFLPLDGGHRLGLAGSAVMKDGAISSFRSISSAALRICREIRGIAEPYMAALRKGGTLIVSPPGGGKTTFLRDLCRCISDSGMRVSIVDERSEIAAMSGSHPQFDIGRYTDVIEGCPKADGILCMLRSMNPEFIAVDEITSDEDSRAVLSAANCGVGLIATAHAGGYEELLKRTAYKKPIESGVFKNCVIISNHAGRREYRVVPLQT